MPSKREKITPPSRLNTFREAFAAADMIGLPAALVKARAQAIPAGAKLPIIVLPGIGADDYSTWPLRYFLKRHGYPTEGWGIGRNTGGRGLIENLDELSDRWKSNRNRVHRGEGEVPALVDRMHDRTKARAEALGSPVVLIGWSLGGYVAREVARDLPEHVASVITMGSPVVGGPKYTSAAAMYKARDCDLDWIEQEVEKRFENPIKQPITAIYSKRDGVVGWRSSIDHYSPHVTHIEVRVSHIGMGLNAGVWQQVLKALKRDLGHN
ncbi:MAG: alpha/beta fold hydrolase [Pseudomonadales bacterium]|nr:alpha/beta fold hydrolase [Pseudomonadales bacterium]